MTTKLHHKTGFLSRWLWLSLLIVVASVFVLLAILCADTIAQSKMQPSAVELTGEERAWLAAHPNIELSYPSVFEPAVIVNTDGSYRGTLVDVLALLNQRLGTDFKLAVKSVPDIISQINQQTLGGVLSIHPGHADKYGWLKTKPYMNSYPTIFARKGFSFTAPSDLAGKKIALIDKIFFSQKLIDLYGTGATLIKVKTGREGLERVKDGTADLYVGSSRNSYLLGKYQFYDIVAKFQFYDHPTPNVMAVRNDWPQLVSILNKGLASISTEEIESIVRNWTGPSEAGTTETNISLTLEEQTWLNQDHTVKVRAADWPPYMITSKDEPPQGISVEYLKLIKERTGINFEYEVTRQSFAEFLEAMKQRSGPDMTLLLARTPAREESFSITKPYITTSAVIFTHEEDELIMDINGLAGKSVAILKGHTSQKIMSENFPGIKLVLFDSDLDALKAVAFHKADAYIGNLIVASHIIHRYGVSDLKVVAPAPTSEQTLSMGIRKDWPELTSIIDKVLASITEEEKTAISNKYVAVRYETGIMPNVFFKRILVIAGVTLCIVLLFVAWNAQLRRQVNTRTAEVLESEEKFRALMEQSPFSILIFNPDGTIKEINGAWMKLWGLSEDELPEILERYNVLEDQQIRKLGGTPLVERVFRGESVEMPPLEYDVKQAMEDVNCPVRNVFKRWIHVRLFPIKDHQDEVLHVALFQEDISERIISEQKEQEYQQRLKALASQLILAEEQERRRIAAGLHDNVSQTLAISRLQLAAVINTAEDARLKGQLDDVSSMLLTATRDTRQLIFELSSPAIVDLGLGPAIREWVGNVVTKNHDIDFELIDNLEGHDIEQDQRAILFRNVRELLTNTLKYARANKVVVVLDRVDKQIKVTVEDNGVGFNHELVMKHVSSDGGFGLFSIQERMSDFGGKMKIRSAPHQGCTIIMSVPYDIDSRRAVS